MFKADTWVIFKKDGQTVRGQYKYTHTSGSHVVLVGSTAQQVNEQIYRDADRSK